jgi:HAD superfamily hydrolase (TIGR01509 family)
MSNQPAIRGVIFDMDGVLTNSEPLINAAAIAMFKEQGLIVQPDDFLPFVGAGEDRYLGGVAEKHQFLLDLPSAKRRTYEIYLGLVPSRLEAFPGAQDVVRACRQAGLRVGVASSADRVKIMASLEKIGLPPGNWDAIVTGEEVKATKPAPDIFLAAAAKLGLAPEQCVVVEDAVNGVQAVKAASMRCVAVAQTFPVERLQGANLVRSRISEVSVADLVGVPEAAVPGTPPPVIGPLPPVIPCHQVVALSRPWGFWATVGLGAVILTATIAAQAAVAVVWLIALMAAHRSVVPRDLETNGLFLALATSLAAPVMTGLSWVFARMRRGMRPTDYLGWRTAGRREMVWWTIVLLGMVLASDALTSWQGRPIVPEFMSQAYQTAGFLPLFWLAIVILAPLGEETFFRGFLFEGMLHSRLGAAGAITITSGLWALTHIQYDAYGVATIFVSGLLLGYVRLKTRSLYATIYLHCLMNFIATTEAAVMFRFFPPAA